MSDSRQENLLARLAKNSENDNPWEELDATPPRPAAAPRRDDQGEDPELQRLLNRLQSLTGDADTQPARAAASGPQPAPNGPRPQAVQLASASPPTAVSDDGVFVPLEMKSFQEMSLTDSEVEALTAKYLLARGDAKGRQIANQLKLPFVLLEELLRRMKQDQLLVYRGSAEMNDYVYQLTDLGREQARMHSAHCTYFGAAPVSLEDYIASVKAQSLQKQHPTQTDLERTFKDLLVNPTMLRRLGPAINSGKGMFLFGAPGNGKTSIAKRVTRAFGKYIWMPRAIGVDGEVMRVYDPLNHESAPPDESEGLLQSIKIDQRWVRVVRPTIVVGGELTMENLEVMLNTSTGINEAPLQMKSNCGTLVIDDFGRQRISTDELLNRWIVPLEERVDYLNLASGKTIQVPFDQLIVFSTNLEPRDLVDEAFLRRIPYKIEVTDPTESEFRQLFELMCKPLGFDFNEQALDYLIERHYRNEQRCFRCCHPRDLLSQIHDLCLYLNEPPVMKEEYFDAAVENYFSVV